MNRTWKTGWLAGLALGAAAFSVGNALMAQNATPANGGKVACVDVVKVFNEYQRQKDLAEEMKQLQDRLELENQQRRQKIDALQAALDAMDPSDPTYLPKQKEFMQSNIDYKNWFDINQAGLGREVGVWTANVYREIIKAAGEVAQSQGIDVVLYRDEFQPTSFDPNEIREQIRNRRLLYASPSTDMSQPVLDKLNAAYRAQPRKSMLQVP